MIFTGECFGPTDASRILIVDDDPVARQIARHLLEHAGYVVDAVDAGATALEALRRERYVLLLLDIKLPDMDGFAVAVAVAAVLPVGHRPWIVAASALADVGDEPRYLAAGFDACLGKPLRRASLIACVEAGIAQRAHLL
ncbi:MAG: response regulator [Chloroflexales bacterium]